MNFVRKIGFAVALGLLLAVQCVELANAQLVASANPETTNFPVAGVNDPQFGSAVMLAVENGYFRNQGLNVDLKVFATGAAQKEPIVAGQIPVGVVGQQVWLIMRAAGVPISIIAKSSDVSETIQLIVSDKIKEPKDLEGKKIGYLKGSILDAVYLSFCKAYGVDGSKVEALNMSQPEMLTSFLQGQLDAIVVAGTFGPDAVKKGASVGARLMHTAATSWITGKPEKKRLVPGNVVLVANDDFIKKNPNTLAAFLRAVEQANMEIQNDRQKAAEIIAGRTKIPLEDVLNLWNLSSYGLSISPDLLTDLETDKSFLTSVDAIRGDVDIKAGINEQPLKAVLPQYVTLVP
jgi:ABC-type nitrate/sulfonate/bicarbonate transport system substrate-binding protein